LDRGVRVGLGTDVAGGYSADIMGVMRWAVGISRISEGARLEQSGSQATASEDQVVKAESNLKSISVNWKEALYLGTRGGALALGLGGGLFKIGAPFDAQQSTHCIPPSRFVNDTLIILAFSMPLKSKFGASGHGSIGLP
jgi:guanine deaminase